MGLFPCDHHGQRYRGSQQTIYPAIVDKQLAERKKQRLCPECFAEAHAWCAKHLVDVEADVEESDLCHLCDAAGELLVFVTAYAANADRQDFYGRLCKGECQTTARVALFGAGAAPTPAAAPKTAPRSAK
jgi:hypothetical protein